MFCPTWVTVEPGFRGGFVCGWADGGDARATAEIASEPRVAQARPAMDCDSVCAGEENPVELLAEVAAAASSGAKFSGGENST